MRSAAFEDYELRQNEDIGDGLKTTEDDVSTLVGSKF